MHRKAHIFRFFQFSQRVSQHKSKAQRFMLKNNFFFIVTSQISFISLTQTLKIYLLDAPNSFNDNIQNYINIIKTTVTLLLSNGNNSFEVILVINTQHNRCYQRVNITEISIFVSSTDFQT